MCVCELYLRSWRADELSFSLFSFFFMALCWSSYVAHAELLG